MGERMVSHGQASSSSTVRSALDREALQYGRMVKLQGIVDYAGLQRADELQLCAAASEALSRMVGGPVPIKAVAARWLRPPQQQHTPRLLVELESTAMARAVMKLKGRAGAAGKLQAGQRILCEFGPVEMAVREALYKVVREGGQGDMWVSRATLMVDGRLQPLAAEAVVAGLQAVHKPARRMRP
jgi:hypothetical protein